ncbi:tetratricopeptide repeat protein [Psychroserpens sp. Hel_I_66]|uniref:tetratricopeptide repeat protein n=1 Tax=Psychroserpens sp. Hel_I_66 TaxID=1250004 RepID=UPI000648FB51|nr:tetratricopeptide repeat protein [Psychroserpens sp. Hel_I_66]
MKSISVLICLLVFTLSSAQDNEKIKKISDQACECISKIDIDKTKKEKSEEIKVCIQSANLGYQVDNDLLSSLEKSMDSLSKSKIKTDSLVVSNDKNFIIDISENYEEIEEYLYNNCEFLKEMYFTDNKASDKSYSERKKAMKFYEEGQIAFANEDYEKAITLFRKAVNKDKNFAFAWDNLGYSYRKLNNFDEAISCYKKSLALDPKGKMPLMNIAVAYALNGDLPNALSAYENYKITYDNDPEGFYGIGRILYFQKDYEPALQNMIKAYYLYLEMDSPYNIDAQKHIGFIYKEMKELGQLEAFNKIAKENKLQVNIED